MTARDQWVQTAALDWELTSREVAYLIRACGLLNQLKTPHELHEIGRRECPDAEPELIQEIINAHYPMRCNERERCLGAESTQALVLRETTWNPSVSDLGIKGGKDEGSCGFKGAAPARDDSSEGKAEEFSRTEADLQEDLRLLDSDD